MNAVWWCRCPHITHDRDGHTVGCQAVARIVDLFDLPSTSGDVLHVRTHCDCGHRTVALYEAITLLA